jgi:hypothetical protein
MHDFACCSTKYASGRVEREKRAPKEAAPSVVAEPARDVLFGKQEGDIVAE